MMSVLRAVSVIGFTLFAMSASGATTVTEPSEVFPMSLLLWCFSGSFAGMGVALPTRMRAALDELQGRTALVVEVVVYGIGGLVMLVSTSLLGFGFIVGAHLLAANGFGLLSWMTNIPVADLFPVGILLSALLQYGAQPLMTAAVEVGVSWVKLFKRGRTK